MNRVYTYSALAEMTPSEVEEIKAELQSEYAGLLQQHHQNCASVLFLQTRIEEHTGKIVPIQRSRKGKN